MVALVHDLGRPERFHHMLRVAKPTSPMSVGTWILTLTARSPGSPPSARPVPAAGRLRDGLVGRLLGLSGRPAGLVAAVVAPAVASYTAVLLTDTATPTWHDMHETAVRLRRLGARGGRRARHARGAGRAGRTRAPAGGRRRAARARRERKMESAMGLTAEPCTTGTPVAQRASKALTAAGALGAALSGPQPHRRGRLRAALMAGSACLRFGVFEAGQQSAKDPKYVVVPQRERLARSGPTRHPSRPPPARTRCPRG